MSGVILGMGETYNSNSSIQKDAIESSIEFIEKAIDVLDVKSVNIIADFGCSHGLNSIQAMKAIIDYLRKTKKYVKEPLVIHNDLPTNDWTQVFQHLIEDNSYKGTVCGRSFYEQCLPNNSLEIGYSSTSLHWLSKKPCNVSSHCSIGLSEDLKEREAFRHRSYFDYCQFLQHRSHEFVSGGVLILTINCTDEQEKSGFESLKETLYKCAQLLPLTSQELLNFTLPVYFRSFKECTDEKVFTQYSFELIKSNFVPIRSNIFKQWKKEEINLDEFARLISSFVQTWAGPFLEQALMNNERTKEDISMVSNQFWSLYEEKIKDQPDIADFCFNYTHLIFKKK